MNTFLSSVQITLKESYRSFARQEIAPLANLLESGQFPLKDLWSKLGPSGYLGITVPQEHGGLGEPFFHLALFAEAVSEYEAGIALSLASHAAVAELIKRYGSEPQKMRYLPLLARGETVATMAFSEEGAGTDFEAVQTTASPTTSGYLIKGKKVWVVNADSASLIILAARLEDSSELGLFLIDLTGGENIAVSANRLTLGLRSASANDVELNDLVVPLEGLLGNRGEAIDQIHLAMDIAKVLVAASALGLAQGALQQSIEHARSREQFGEPISQFQAIQWKLADMSVDAEAARLMTYRAAWSKDEKPAKFHKHAAMCKWLASRVARVHTGEALQVLGARGVSADSPVERFYRDAKVTEIANGTSEFQKILLVQELGI